MTIFKKSLLWHFKVNFRNQFWKTLNFLDHWTFGTFRHTLSLIYMQHLNKANLRIDNMYNFQKNLGKMTKLHVLGVFFFCSSIIPDCSVAPMIWVEHFNSTEMVGPICSNFWLIWPIFVSFLSVQMNNRATRHCLHYFCSHLCMSYFFKPFSLRGIDVIPSAEKNGKNSWKRRKWVRAFVMLMPCSYLGGSFLLFVCRKSQGRLKIGNEGIIAYVTMVGITLLHAFES